MLNDKTNNIIYTFQRVNLIITSVESKKVMNFKKEEKR